MADDLLNGNLANILNFLAAAGGLGTAAFGLVDAFKAFDGGISNAGFGHIRQAVEKLSGPPDEAATPAFGRRELLATLRAQWLNGVDKAQQKAVAKSLIRLGLSPESAPQLAAATGLDVDALRLCAQHIAAGSALSTQDLNALGRFDAIVSAVLDQGYERADQQYRNAAKLAAACLSLLLSIVAGGLLFLGGEGARPVDYLGSRQFLAALLAGLMATPLAPVAKDLSTSLSAAVKAVSAVRR